MEAGSLVRLGHSARSPLLVLNFYTHNGYGERRDNCSYDVAEAGSRESTCLGAMGEFCHLVYL